jgi:hypothetical protein
MGTESESRKKSNPLVLPEWKICIYYRRRGRDDKKINNMSKTKKKVIHIMIYTQFFVIFGMYGTSFEY